jgi:diguanylate cyclase (GGDEF)-like protein
MPVRTTIPDLPAEAAHAAHTITRRDFRQWSRIATVASVGGAIGLLGAALAPGTSSHDQSVWLIAVAAQLVLAVASHFFRPEEPSNTATWLSACWALSIVGFLVAASHHTAAFPYFMLVPLLSGAYLLPERQSIALSLVSVAVLFIGLHLRRGGFDLLLWGQVGMVNSCGTVLTRSLRKSRDHLFADLERVATTDALTGLANRGRFEAVAERLVTRARVDESALALVIFDIDHFKQLNDSQGHAAGDAALKAFAATLAEHTRPTDLIARIGGEEFAAVMPGAKSTEAAAFAERVGAALRNAHGTGTARITVSAGVAEFARGDDAERLLREADRALYAAKAAGRDRVVLSDAVDRITV